jgi:hypothetical protein
MSNLLVGQQAFCSRNRNTIVHSWQNPNKPFATRFDTYDIDPEESFIMIGYGCHIDHFINVSKSPDQLSSAELKEEILCRTRNDPGVHPSFRTLAKMCVTNSAYLHVVKNCDVIKPWKSQSVTLIGDAVFKYVFPSFKPFIVAFNIKSFFLAISVTVFLNLACPPCLERVRTVPSSMR